MVPMRTFTHLDIGNCEAKGELRIDDLVTFRSQQ